MQVIFLGDNRKKFDKFLVWSRKNASNQLDVRVDVYKDVLERIRDLICKSKTEEGGKLLGLIQKTKNSILIRVETFIDSGPGVDNSSSHIYPDGEYQEMVFRLIEKYNPEIEHLGSWHSHHCNNLNTLSDRDVAGYFDSVNNPNYHPNFFLVILVTGIQENFIGMRYYLFVRHHKNCYEISKSNINIIEQTSPYEQILKQAEILSLSKRESRQPLEVKVQPITEKARKANDHLKLIRKEDKIWISKRDPSATIRKHKSNDSIRWSWAEEGKHIKININYSLPGQLKPRAKHALLDIFYEDTQIVSPKKIQLNDCRHSRIISIINKAISKAHRIQAKEAGSQQPINRQRGMNKKRTRKGRGSSF